MKKLLYLLTAVVLMAVATTERAEAKRVVVPKMYIYGFAASFTDTVVYFTNVMEVDSAWYETKSKFLLGRNLYSRQLRNFLEKEKKEQSRTCLVVFDKKRSRLEKKYLKMRKLYTTSKDGKQHFDLRYITDQEFKFKTIDIADYELDEEAREKLLASKQKLNTKKSKKKQKKEQKLKGKEQQKKEDQKQ